jgi:epidermal growth factor receptor kinase substrate 8
MFDFRICKQLHGMTGNELFSLTKSQLEKHCGKDEGRRLDSQLTIQRNVSGVSEIFTEFSYLSFWMVG